MILDPTNSQHIVTITETNVSTVYFETEEEARQFMNEPDYDLCEWECIENKIELNSTTL